MRNLTSVLANLIICAAVLGGAVWAVIVINRTEPTAQQLDNKRKSAALVETLRVTRGSYSPTINALGTVQPAQSVVLAPRISGQVIQVSEKFVPGGMIRQGEMLLNIDPADFEIALATRESELQQVTAAMEIEQGRQSLAASELELLGDSIDDANRALVLRKPQLASIKAQVAASEAAVRQARLDLQRTRVLAPFDAHVIRRSVDVGSQISPNNDLGQLVGLHQYWIIASIPQKNLPWIEFAESGNTGSQVRLTDSQSSNPTATRSARVTRMIGTLDQQTRMVRVLITVDDPLGLTTGETALILNSLVELEIAGRSIENVIRVPRQHVHDRDTVWVMQAGKLEIRETQVAFRDAQFAYISSGLEDQDEVVTSTLSTVAAGIDLRRSGSATTAESTTPAEVQP